MGAYLAATGAIKHVAVLTDLAGEAALQVQHFDLGALNLLLVLFKSLLLAEAHHHSFFGIVRRDWKSHVQELHFQVKSSKLCGLRPDGNFKPGLEPEEDVAVQLRQWLPYGGD